MFKQSHVQTDPAARERWLREGDHQDRCAVCHWPLSNSGWPGFAKHHVVFGANGRSDEPENLLLVCHRDHSIIHGARVRDEKTNELLPDITFGMVLGIKSTTTEWNPERLRELYHQRLPEWKILPPYYMAERIRWRGPA